MVRFLTSSKTATILFSVQVTIPLMDRLGRRTLHLSGLAGIILFSILITVASSMDETKSGVGVFLVVSTFGFVVSFALGPGSIPWLIAGELFNQVH